MLPKPDWQSDNGAAQMYQGDCMSVLAGLPSQSVQCCVTSPPYWGLRDYGTATWEGGDVECDHKDTHQDARNLNTNASDQRQGREASVGKLRDGVSGVSHTCGKCGATRIDDQIGLEQTPDEYVAKMVEVFREVRRVLRDDGTVWLNLGDTYTGPKGNTRGEGAGGGQKRGEAMGFNVIGKHKVPHGLKPKDLIGIPWRVALALQADGWYLRQDIIWHKPNPMPESVTDRCTKAHEYIFLLAKSQTYYYDAEAVKEDTDRQGGVPRQFGASNQEGTMRKDIGATFVDNGKRNKRSVWTVTTKPFKDAHFATFPPDLIEPCILAGCPEGGVVLDPFTGSGTTGMVSIQKGRRFVGIELNPDYLAMARQRIQGAIDDWGLFAAERNKPVEQDAELFATVEAAQ